MVATKQSSIQSKLFIDQIVYLFKAYQSHNKPIPELYILETSNERTCSIVEKYHIERTPTTIVLDE